MTPPRPAHAASVATLRASSCAELKSLIVTDRAPEGICAVLLPFTEGERPDLPALQAQLARIMRVGLVPAVNMDTGFVQVLTPAQRRVVLAAAAEACRGRRFIAGASPADGDTPLATRYRAEIDAITAAGGTPILFPSPELAALDEAAVVALHANVTRDTPGCLAFELGRAFVPWGRIYGPETAARLMEIPGLLGMKHSSLERGIEWERLALRARIRPEFKIYTGNDLAIDMITYGSDYLLGLAAFHPEAFAARDRLWATGDARFFELNDALQTLGSFAFRTPVPAYRHSAAQFLKLRGVIPHDGIPAGAPRRPESDVEILATLEGRIASLLAGLPAGGP